MKFKIGDKVYDAASIYKLPLRLVLQLQMESREFGREINPSDLASWASAMSKMKTENEAATHPDAAWLMAVTIWVARKVAGDDVTFEQAVDLPLEDIVWLKEPRDRRPANPTKGRPRKGSGPVAKSRPASAGTKTSNVASTAD